MNNRPAIIPQFIGVFVFEAAIIVLHAAAYIFQG